MPESILIDITTVVLLGIGAQWLAWHFRLPAILLLLIGGFMAGPVLGLLDPQALQADWVYAFVSLATGIVLFESGLRLRIAKLREAGAATRNLVTLGALITCLLGTAAAYYIVGFNLSLSILIGILLIVTGPTVVTPLLRHIRPKGRVGTVAKWEGITIDPVGAILALLALETIILLHEPQGAPGEGSLAASHVVEGLFLEVFVSLGVSVAAAGLLIVILQRRLVPDVLHAPVTLMILVAAFVTAEALQHEAGLLAAALIGIAMANQPFVPVQRAAAFKENLHVLLVGALFILLSARLEIDALQYVDWSTLLFLGVLMLVVRPLAAFASGLGTDLTWEEQTFLSWLAPRGVVAVAVAALFSFKLTPVFPQEVEALVPVVFAVVLGTVAIYGLTITPLARWLGLADPNPQGILFVGAAPWVQTLARTVQQLGFTARLIDSDPDRVQQARREGLHAEHVPALSAPPLDEIDLNGVGRLLVTTPYDEVGALATLHFSELFAPQDVFQLRASPHSSYDPDSAASHLLSGCPLFDEATSYASLAQRFEQGHEIKVFPFAEKISYEDMKQHFEDGLVPLFIVRGGDTLEIVSAGNPLKVFPGDTIVALIDPDQLSALSAPAHPPEDATATREAADADPGD